MAITRIAPLPLERWDVELRDNAGRMLAAPNGGPLNIFATLANHPKLMKRWLVLATHVLGKSTLPPRDRELLILRVGWLCRAPYEWAQHVAIGLRSGIEPDEIDAIKVGPTAPGWSELDAALLRATDELHHHHRIGDATWALLAARYDDAQMLDLITAVGSYTLVSMLLNSCGVEIDEGIPVDPQLADVPEVP